MREFVVGYVRRDYAVQRNVLAAAPGCSYVQLHDWSRTLAAAARRCNGFLGREFFEATARTSFVRDGIAPASMFSTSSTRSATASARGSAVSKRRCPDFAAAWMTIMANGCMPACRLPLAPGIEHAQSARWLVIPAKD